MFNFSPQWPNKSDRVGDRKNILTLEEINALCTCFNVFSCCLGTTNLIFNKRSQPLWIFIISLFVQQCCIPWLSSLGCKDRTKHTKVVRWYHKHLSLHVATHTHTQLHSSKTSFVILSHSYFASNCSENIILNI